MNKKIAVITDQHFGARNDRQAILLNQERFYKEIFFPKIDSEDVKIVFDLGDTFDRRKGIDFNTLAKVRKFYFDELRDRDIQLYSIVGNHTTYYRDSNIVNSLELTLQEYKNIKVISQKPEEIEIYGRKFLFAPWINSSNYDESMEEIKKSRADILCAHLELEGFQMQRGNISKHGMNKKLFSHFDRVWTGHFHSPSIQDNVHYLGSPTETCWADYGDEKGFYVYDAENDNLDFVLNDIGLHEKVVYEDGVKLDIPDLKNKIVRIVVKEKDNEANYRKFMGEIFSNSPDDVKIEETFHKNSKEVSQEISIENLENMTTMDIIKNEVKKHDFKKHKEAIELFESMLKEAEAL